MWSASLYARLLARLLLRYSVQFEWFERVDVQIRALAYVRAFVPVHSFTSIKRRKLRRRICRKL